MRRVFSTLIVLLLAISMIVSVSAATSMRTLL